MLYVAPVVESLDLNHGPTAGGTTITITGGNFGVTASSPRSVTVGGVEWPNCSWQSDTEMACVSIAGTGGGHMVLVTVDGITSSSSNSVEFGYDGNVH